MVDSDEAQIELTGEKRGGEMAQAEWEKYSEDGYYQRTRDRYASNTEERQAEKRAIFDEIDPDGEYGRTFFEEPETWDSTFGDL